MENKSWSFKQFLVLGLEIIIIYSTLFSKWIGIDMYYQQFSTTLLLIGKRYDMLEALSNNLGISHELPAFLIFVTYALLLFGVFTTWNTVVSVFEKNRLHDKFSKAGFVYAIIMSATFILLILIINGSIDSQTDGYISGLLTLKSPAYFTLALGVAGCLICDKMPDTFFASAGSAASSFVHNTAAKVASFVSENAAAAANDTTTPKSAASESTASAEPKAQVRKCANCGWTTENGEVQFCANCGTKLVTELFCPNCGKKLEPDMKFCPYCGADVHNN